MPYWGRWRTSRESKVDSEWEDLRVASEDPGLLGYVLDTYIVLVLVKARLPLSGVSMNDGEKRRQTAIGGMSSSGASSL